ncbi:NAD(P)H-binding protein [Actinosynnema sp. NPDC051121]
MILVTGATGNVGREVVQALADAGAPVRALVRRTSDLPVAQAVGDLDDPASLDAALGGVRGVFLLPGYRDMPGLLAGFAAAGVERVVLLSSQAAVATDTANVVSAYMIDSETAVRESGVDWTILRPAAFMSNALRWLPQLRTGDVVSDAFGDVPIAVVDPADIAAVAAEALLEPVTRAAPTRSADRRRSCPPNGCASSVARWAVTCASRPWTTTRPGLGWPPRPRPSTSTRSSASTATAPSTRPRFTRPWPG